MLNKGDTEPSLDSNVSEGVTTTKTPNWPIEMPPIGHLDYVRLARVSRQWLDQLKPLAARGCTLLVNGIRYSLTPNESLGGNEKSLPTECTKRVIRSLIKLAEYGEDLQDIYNACCYACESYEGSRNGTYAIMWFADLEGKAPSFRRVLLALGILLQGRDIDCKLNSERVKAYQKNNPEAEKKRAEKISKTMKEYCSSRSKETLKHLGAKISEAKMSLPEEERHEIYCKLRNRQTRSFEINGEIKVADSSWEESMYRLLDRIVPGRFTFHDNVVNLLHLDNEFKKDWCIDFIIDGDLVLDVKGFWFAEKKFFAKDLPGFLKSEYAKKYSLAIYRYDASLWDYKSLEELLADCSWYHIVEGSKYTNFKLSHTK